VRELGFEGAFPVVELCHLFPDCRFDREIGRPQPLSNA
jgi:hypothetical protein